MILAVRLAFPLLAALFVASLAQAAVIQVEPLPLAPGQAAIVSVCHDGELKQAFLDFMGKKSALIKGPGNCLYGVVAVDLGTKPGVYTLRVIYAKTQASAARMEVGKRDYGVRRITVAKKFMSLTPKQLAWYKEDKAAINAAYRHTADDRLWTGGFVRPLNSKVVGPFGRRSVINGQERSPHGGVDMRGAKGDPIRASADGRVAMVRKTYFGGLMVILDHGQGIMSRYLHLSRAQVKAGRMVRRGQVIGLVGASGRVTGPHLHFDVRMSGARVDPLAWIKLSGQLAHRLGEK